MDDVKSLLLKISGTLLIIIIGYNLYTGATIQKVGIPGIFEIEFGPSTEGNGSSSNGNTSNTTQPSVQVSNVWLEHNVDVNGKIGMIIHTDFFINHFNEGLGEISAYFFFEDGTIVRDSNGAYSSIDGQVSIGDRFVPPYDDTRYEDFQLSIPYEEIVFDSGTYNLKLRILVRDKQNSITLGQSDWVFFQLVNE